MTETQIYRATTRSIQITVTPRYLPDRSEPSENRYFWAYTIEITNLGREVVQLKTRTWNITDAKGKKEKVHGPGVVGKQPILRPGERFEYTSGCPLTTPSGTMEGHYDMQTEAGTIFKVEIPAFSLDLPGTQRVLN